MASHVNPTLGFSFLQELGSNKIIKNNQACLLITGGRKHELILASSVSLQAEHLLKSWKPLCSSSKSTMMKLKFILRGMFLPQAKLKSLQKKHNPKRRVREKDYKRNHLHACESLVSLMVGSEHHRKITMPSLKESCGDLSELLTQLSIGIAGTAMAVFFFVICNVASRRVTFCANKVFDTGLSISLVMLSWTVNRLREVIVGVNKRVINEEEISIRVERRINEVYFKAAIVITMVAFRFG